MQERHIPEAFYRTTFDRTSVGMGLVGMRARWIAVNDALCGLLGYTEAELMGLTWRDITHPDDVPTDMAHIAQLLAGAIDTYSVRKRCLRRDGGIVEMQVNVTMARAAAPEESFFIIQLLDVPRALAEEEERRQRERIRLLVENVSDGFIGMDEDGTITEWNRQAERILQWRTDEAIGRPMASLLVPERLRAAHEAGLQRFLRTGQARIIDTPVHMPMLRKDGVEIEAEMTIAAARHLDRYHFATFVRDITERKEFERKLERQATHDFLTGLPNRFAFMRRVDEAIGDLEQDRRGATLALVFIDLDGFKQVNDRHGHHVGDRVLIAFAAALQSCLRGSDVAGRLAGDEFVVMIGGRGDAAGDVAAVARRILDAAQAVAGDTGLTGASIGIAVYERGVTAEELLRRSDAAMYLAKETGKNRFAFHGSPPSRHSRESGNPC